MRLYHMFFPVNFSNLLRAHFFKELGGCFCDFNALQHFVANAAEYYNPLGRGRKLNVHKTSSELFQSKIDRYYCSLLTFVPSSLTSTT